MSQSGYADVHVDKIMAETADAFRLEIGCQPVWVPKSQVRDAHLYEVGETDLWVSLSEWICDKKGIEYN